VEQGGTEAVHPGYDESNVEHPAAVMFAVVDWVNNSPVAVDGVRHHACYSAICSSYNECQTLNQDAQRHPSGARVIVT